MKDKASRTYANLIAIYKFALGGRWQPFVPHEGAIGRSKVFQEKALFTPCNAGMVTASPSIGKHDVIVGIAPNGYGVAQIKLSSGLMTRIYFKKCHGDQLLKLGLGRAAKPMPSCDVIVLLHNRQVVVSAGTSSHFIGKEQMHLTGG
jgi:hypothetical protein